MPLNAGGAGANLTFQVIAQDLASRQLSGVSGALVDTGSAFRQFRSVVQDSALISASIFVQSIEQIIGSAQRFIGMGFSPLKGAFDISKEAAGFEYSMAGIAGVMRKTLPDINELTRRAREAAIATKFKPEEAAGGLLALAQAGFGASQQMKALQPALDMAEASLGQLTPNETAGLAVTAMRVFNVEAGKLTGAFDQMASAASAARIDFSDLPMALGNIARGAIPMKASLNEALTTFGMVKDVLPRVEISSNAAGIAMQNMVRPRSVKAMQEIGIAVSDSQGRMRPFLDIVAELTSHTAQMTDEQRGLFMTQAFGQRAVQGLQIIMKRLRDETGQSTPTITQLQEAVNRLRTTFKGTGGEVGIRVTELRKTMQGQVELMGGSWAVFKEQIATFFTGIIVPAIDWLRERLNALIDVMVNMSPTTKYVIGVSVVLASVLFGMTVTLVTLSFLWMTLGSVYLAMTGQALTLAAVKTSLAGSMALVTVAASTTWAAIVFLATGLWTLASALIAVSWHVITFAVSLSVQALSAIASTAVAIASLSYQVLAFSVHLVAMAVPGVLALAGSLLTAAVPAVLSLVAAFWPFLAIGAVIVGAVLVLSNLFEGFGNTVAGVLEPLNALYSRLEGIVSLAKEGWTAISSLLSGFNTAPAELVPAQAMASFTRTGPHPVSITEARERRNQLVAQGIMPTLPTDGLPVTVTNSTLPTEPLPLTGTAAATQRSQSSLAGLPTGGMAPPPPIDVAAAVASVTSNTGQPGVRERAGATPSMLSVRSVLNLDSRVVAEVEERRRVWERSRKGRR